MLQSFIHLFVLGLILKHFQITWDLLKVQTITVTADWTLNGLIKDRCQVAKEKKKIRLHSKSTRSMERS